MLLLIAALIIASPFILRVHFQASRKRLARAQRAWEMVEQAAHPLLEDRRLNPEIGDLVEFVVNRVGDGSLTRTFLVAIIFKRLNGGSDKVTRSMNTEQERQFMRLMVAALFYDSLRTTFSGSIIRRVLYWLASTATDKNAPVTKSQVAPVVSAAGRLCHNH